MPISAAGEHPVVNHRRPAVLVARLRLSTPLGSVNALESSLPSHASGSNPRPPFSMVLSRRHRSPCWTSRYVPTVPFRSDPADAGRDDRGHPRNQAVAPTPVPYPASTTSSLLTGPAGLAIHGSSLPPLQEGRFLRRSSEVLYRTRSAR